MADIIVDKIFKQPVFTWDADNLSSNSNATDAFLKAIKAADNGDFHLVLNFARSYPAAFSFIRQASCKFPFNFKSNFIIPKWRK